MSDYQPTPPPATPYTGSGAVQKTPLLSILSLIGGILSVVSSFFFVGLLFGIAGLILGVIARRKEPSSKALWLTGLILSIVGLVISLIVIAFWVIVVVAAATHSATTSP